MSRCKTCLFAFALIICATPLFAGTLASDGSSYLGIWNSSTGYVGTVPSADLFGDVEWAVYGPGTFPAAFLGYAPDPTHFVYAYQVFETGSAPVSLFDVALDNPAFDIGTFTGGGVSGDVATTAVLIPAVNPDDALWEFAGIPSGGTSVGLAFSSPFAPKFGFGVILDDGEIGPVIPLPVPSLIPEPSTVILAAIGLVGLAAFGWRRRKR